MMGAGGGGLRVTSLHETVETNLRGGQSIINPAGKGLLQTANPRNGDVFPMEVIGSCVIPMVSSPVDRVVGISFRIVRDLSYAVFPGAASMKEHQSTISLSVTSSWE